MTPRTTYSDKRGFTLVEILIVVLIIGFLAALAIPSVLRSGNAARTSTFTSDLRALVHASEAFILETGNFPPDTHTGTFPSELLGYIGQQRFEEETPLGGSWDFELNDAGGVTSAVGVYAPTADESYLQKVDTNLDDGDLTAGKFRKITDHRYYFILQE